MGNRIRLDWDPKLVDAVLVIEQSRYDKCHYSERLDCIMELTPDDLDALINGRWLESSLVERHSVRVRTCTIEQDEDIRQAFGNKRVFFSVGDSSEISRFLETPIKIPERVAARESKSGTNSSRAIIYIIGACWDRE